jgi:hypothetical protein
VCVKTMQFNVDVTVRYRTKPTLLHQDLKRSQMGSIRGVGGVTPSQPKSASAEISESYDKDSGGASDGIRARDNCGKWGMAD